MWDTLLDYELWLRLGSFVLLLALMVLWETLAPRRPVQEARSRHGLRNLAITVLAAVLVRVLIPLLPVGLAVVAVERGWGLFNWLDWPAWLEILLAVVVLDFVIYLQHVMFHAVPALWRLHMVHHADLDFDTTTGVRFHPIEILLSLVIKLAAVLVLGPAPVAVLLFEILLNGTALFNHGNVRLPGPVDRILRWVVVTPDMHRVHHSIVVRETNSNFGFNLPWWDRLLGTYRAQPAAGHEGMTIGLDTYRQLEQITLGRLLLLPFGGRRGTYAMEGSDDEHRPAEPPATTSGRE